MAFGPGSPFWQVITSAIPALKLSRFPSHDYLVFIAIPIVILGIAGLMRIIQRTLSWKEFLARAAFVFAWFSLIVFSQYSNLFLKNFIPLEHTQSQSQVSLNFAVTAAVLVLAATIFFIIMYGLGKNIALSSISKSNTLSRSALVIIVILILVDGLAVISDTRTWQERPLNRPYINFNVPLEKNGKLITYTIFENIPNERPARQTTELMFHAKDPEHHNLSWLGYLNGSYMMEDYGNTILLARSIVESNNIYRQYMLMKWTPILLDRNFNMSSESVKITLPASAFSNIIKQQHNQSELCSKFTCDSAFSDKYLIQPKSHDNANDQVVQTRYGINDIVYEVTLKQPKLMVENEIYFPGWKADLFLPDKQMKLESSVVNGVFRAWLLPAGDYKMIAHFHFPNLLAYQSISIVSFAIWIFVIMKYWRRQVAGYNEPMKKKEFVNPH